MKRYDLNIAWSPSTTQDQLLQTLTLASTLGYGTVALNHTLSPGQTGNPTSPLPKRIAGPDGGAPKLPAVLHRATPIDVPTVAYRLLSKRARALGHKHISAIDNTTVVRARSVVMVIAPPP